MHFYKCDNIKQCFLSFDKDRYQNETSEEFFLLKQVNFQSDHSNRRRQKLKKVRLNKHTTSFNFPRLNSKTLLFPFSMSCCFLQIFLLGVAICYN